MTFKQYLICITAIGIFSACGDQVETDENYQNPKTPYEALSFRIEDLEIHEIQTQEDFDHVLDLSRVLKKPILLEIAAFSSVNSRKFEDYIWTSLPVYSILKDEFMIARMYVDDRTPLANERENDTVSNC